MEVLENKDDRIAQIDILRFEYGRKKICECKNGKYEIDVQNRLIYCRGCGAIKNPFDVCVDLARRYAEINNTVQKCYEQARELYSYQPFLREAKRYEKMMREKDMLPVCPRCGEIFEWQEVNALANKHFFKKDGVVGKFKEDKR